MNLKWIVLVMCGKSEVEMDCVDSVWQSEVEMDHVVVWFHEIEMDCVGNV